MSIFLCLCSVMFTILDGAEMVELSKPIQFQPIREDCRHIINALPTYHMANAPFFAFLRTNDAATTDIHSVHDWLVRECVSRYHLLMRQTLRNEIIINNASTANNNLSANWNKENLNILDLDGTLIDQPEEHTGCIFMDEDQLSHLFDTINAEFDIWFENEETLAF